MRLIEIARVVGNGRKRQFVFSDQFEARFEAMDFIERLWRKASVLINQLVQVARRDPESSRNAADIIFGGVFRNACQNVAYLVQSLLAAGSKH